MPVIDRDDWYLYFIREPFITSDINVTLPEDKEKWIKDTFDEMRKVQEYLKEVSEKLKLQTFSAT